MMKITRPSSRCVEIIWLSSSQRQSIFHCVNDGTSRRCNQDNHRLISISTMMTTMTKGFHWQNDHLVQSRSVGRFIRHRYHDFSSFMSLHHHRGIASRSEPALDGPSTPATCRIVSDDRGSTLPSIYGRVGTRREWVPREEWKDSIAAKNNDGVHNQYLPPKQSSYTTRILFDTLAPHMEIRTLHKLTKKLSSGIITQSSIDPTRKDAVMASRREMALDRALDAMFETTSATGIEWPPSVKSEYTWKLWGHAWMRQTLRAYFMGGKLDKPQSKPRHRTNDDDNNIPIIQTNTKLSYESDPTYPPIINRRRHKENKDILLVSREIRLRHPIQWRKKPAGRVGHEERIRDQHQDKYDDQLRSEAEDLLEVLTSSLPPPHFDKLLGRLDRFARVESDSIKGDVTGGWSIDNDSNGGFSSSHHSSSLPALPPSTVAAQQANHKKDYIGGLGNFLKDCSPSHSHLIAMAVAEFLYVDTGMAVKSVDPNVVGPEKAAANVVGKHRLLHAAQKRYDKLRDDFIVDLMKLQHEFASWDNPVTTEKEKSMITTTTTQPYDTSSMDDDDISSDLSVSEFLKAQEPYSAESRLKQRDEVKGTLVELRQVGLNAEVGAESKNKGRGRPKMGAHLLFTAIRMNKSDDVLSPNTSKSDLMTKEDNATSEDRLVFINNLPIDITEEEIDEIYSRCGLLDSIELFNLRPDLDPGTLTSKRLRELRKNKKLRNKNSFHNSDSSQHRPRTPVYGILRFKTEEGYKVASNPDLCIFGCVIRRHPVLSIKSKAMDTLYLENIPTHLQSINLEQKLALLLEPHDVHVMVDGIKGVGLQEYSKPSSCQVKFPDFQTANHAYHWINEGIGTDNTSGSDETGDEKNNENFQVHWFRTPSNSLDYWTRDLGF